MLTGQVGTCVDVSTWCMFAWLDICLRFFTCPPCEIDVKPPSVQTPGTQMTSIFEGQPPKTRPKLQSKQGSSKGSRHTNISESTQISKWCVSTSLGFLSNPNPQRKNRSWWTAQKLSVASSTIPQLGPFWTAGNLCCFQHSGSESEEFKYPIPLIVRCPSLPAQ